MAREVVENVSGWLKLFSDGTVERQWTGPEEVKQLLEPVPPSNQIFVDGVATRDVMVDPKNGVWVRIYLPQTAQTTDQKLGIVVHFRGGGFCISHADWRMYYTFYTRLVKNSNVICVSVNFRLAPEHRLPAACEDCFGAMTWLSTVARGEKEESWLRSYADFSRCVLIGDSAGGNLVHEIAVRSRNYEKDLLPVCVLGGIALHPGFVRSERSKSEVESPESPFLTLDMLDKFLAMALPVGSNKDHPITNPIGPLAPDLEKLRFPRMMVAIADGDLVRDTEVEYCEAMKRAGHDVEVVISEKVGHSFYLNQIAVQTDPEVGAQTTKLLDAISLFIQSCFSDNDRTQGSQF